MKHPHKALQAIERVAGDSFCEDLEYMLYVKSSKKSPKELKKLLKEAAKKLILIYEMAHCEVSFCPHSTWEDEKYKILNQPEL